VLDQQGLRSPPRDAAPQPRFCSTSDGAHLKQLAATLLGVDAPVERVHIPSRRTAAPDSHAA
jgi:glutamate racemase